MAAERMTRTYRVAMLACVPIVRWWGRMEVTGVEAVPLTGPLLVASNHDSYWDPIAAGIAAYERRQIRALAKSSMWKIKPLALVLDGMGQIPIDRGVGDADALQRAITELRGGSCIGIFPEGTRSKGRTLRARSGIGRLAEAVPETQIVCCAVQGTTDIPRFPRRPGVRVHFFTPAGGAMQPGERPVDLAERLLAELRSHAAVSAAGRRRKAAPPPAD